MDFSKTIVKKLLRMDKPALVHMVSQMSNYAEEIKTKNLILESLLSRTNAVLTDEQKKQIANEAKSEQS